MKRLTLILVILTSSLLSAATTYAAPPERIAISGNFNIDTWQNTSITQRGQNTIIQSVYTEVVAGGASGNVTGEQTAVVHPDGTQTVSGVDTCVCTVGTMSFTAVLRFHAAGDLNLLNGTWEVVRSDQNRVEGNGTFSVNLLTGEIPYRGVITLEQ
jgi:hypothetical protein